MNIFVGNLSFKTTEQDLQRLFDSFGEVKSLKIILDHETLKSRGFAFVEMPDREQAMAAIAALDGKDVDGRALKVNEGRPRDSRGPQGRPPSTGGYNSGDRSGDRSGGGHSFGNRDRSGGGFSQDQDSIYDTKGRSGSGFGNKGRGGRSSGAGGRSGGRRSH